MLKNIIALLLVVFCFGFLIKDFFFIEPRLVPKLSGEELTSKLHSDDGAVLVFFYHSSNGEAARAYFPVLEELAEKFQNKIHFYRYHLSEQSPDPSFNQYWQSDSTFVVFKGGKEIKRTPTLISSARVTNRGFAFLVIKDELNLPQFVATNNPPESIKYLDSTNFQQLVLNSDRFVIVDFTSADCPAAQGFLPEFKRIASQYGYLAEFYLCDIDHSHVHPPSTATPTLGFYNEGQLKAKASGGYSESIMNEATIVGLIVPYL